MSAEESLPGGSPDLSNSNSICDSTTPSVTELEKILESSRVQLNHVDEVWPNLYIGDLVIAHDRKQLRKLGITHVLNAAHSKWGSKGDQIFYGKKINYYGIAADDSPDFDLSTYFYTAAEQIHQTLNTPDAKLLVHCILGMSRSASLVLAYLMIYHDRSLRDAAERVILYRPISPNRGFLEQLRNLDIKLNEKKRKSTKGATYCSTCC
ncbi:dual specificity protein phosphatase 13A-like [Heptranchias perlo]|uniref:dual specificity protein phosphatase 13A-like n=1 Tax=Heptranchias perlo TaxID=212740 RepID=UPI00355955B0